MASTYTRRKVFMNIIVTGGAGFIGSKFCIPYAQ